jgi:hypothetical protein
VATMPDLSRFPGPPPSKISQLVDCPIQAERWGIVGDLTPGPTKTAPGTVAVRCKNSNVEIPSIISLGADG